MSQEVIKGTKELSEKIKKRRLELGFTIEEAATRASVGTKTWCRYEAGESIRKDKAKGICKALNWYTLPNNEEDEDKFDIQEYRSHEAWSQSICELYGEIAAISFVIGSDILLDYVEEDLTELSRMPRGSHVGQLDMSMLKDMLPEQFLVRYDYEFLYSLKTSIERLVKVAHYNSHFVATSVIEELAIFLMMESAEFLMETMSIEMQAYGIDDVDNWKEWIFDLFGDMDIVTCLYSDMYVTNNHIYHFEHWLDEQFYI